MKRILILTLLLFLFNLTAPMVLSKKAATQSQPQTTEEQTTLPAAAQTATGEDALSETDGTAYDIGTLAALMPAEYEPEALAAQALAAKTYDRYLKQTGESAAFPPLPRLSDDELRILWGDGYDTYYAKLEAAVRKIGNAVLEYEGAAFPAVSFPLCAGRTENSETVLGKKYGCLAGVPSDGDLLCPGLETVKRFTADAFLSALGLPRDADRGVSVDERSEAGAVLRFTAGGKSFTGFEAASALGLDSAAFSVSYREGEYAFTVRGKGNFLGMSRYGADYMARQGADYKQILEHYYPGAAVR